MTRPPLFAAACALATLSLALPAAAQDREAPQLRRLDWAGRPAQDTSGTALRRPAPIIPHAGVQPTRAALRPAQPWRPTADRRDGRPGLTPADAFASPNPANAWIPPAPPPEAPRAAPPVVREPTPAPVMGPPPRAVREPERAPEPAPPQARMVQPSPVAPRPVETPPPAAAPAPVDDPMAPRRDAPIYRIQGARPPATAAPAEPQPQPEPQTQPVAEAAPPQSSAAAPARQQGARYYSVHRQAGRTPDRTVLPEPVWLDRMPVEMDSTPSSEDLAAPPETPQMVRGSDGRMRPVQGAHADPIP